MSRTNDISSDNFYTKGRGQRKAWPEGLFFASTFCRKVQNVFVGKCNYIL